MITVIVAFINSKYRTEYNLLFAGTVLIDLKILELAIKIMGV